MRYLDNTNARKYVEVQAKTLPPQVQQNYRVNSHEKRRSTRPECSDITRKIRSRIHACSAIFAISLVATQANATILFEDNFDRANSSNSGSAWSVNEAQANDVAIYKNELRLRDYLPNNANTPSTLTSALFNVDASAFQTVDVTFDWRVLSSTEASDSLFFGISGSNGSISEQLFQTSLESSGSYSTNVSFNGLSNLMLGFWLDVNSHTESIYLDNVMAVGTEPYVTTPNPGNPLIVSNPHAHAVSESSSLALLLFGIAGLAARTLRRRNTSVRKERNECFDLVS